MEKSKKKCGPWLDLFSGIGMYAKGLEEAGFEIIGFCEVDGWARKILKKHWPTKPVSWCIKLLNEKLAELSADSPAKIFHSQELAKGFKGGVAPCLPPPVQDCFGNWLKPICWLDLDTGLWRTWQHCLLEEWGQFLGPWPPAGVMQNGIAWALEPLERPTIAPEYTFLPTPAANEGRGSSRKRYKGSPNFRGAKTSEALRICESDHQYLNPSFAERLMGLEEGYTALETETPPV